MTNHLDKHASVTFKLFGHNDTIGGSLMRRMQWHLAWEKAYFRQQNNLSDQFPPKDNTTGQDPKEEKVNVRVKRIPADPETMKSSAFSFSNRSDGKNIELTTELAERVSTTYILKMTQQPEHLLALGKNQNDFRNITSMKNSVLVCENEQLKKMIEEEKIKLVRQGDGVRVLIIDESIQDADLSSLLLNLREAVRNSGLKLMTVKLNHNTVWEYAPQKHRFGSGFFNGTQLDKVY